MRTSVAEAVAGIENGATIMIGGFGRAGQPVELIDALLDQGARELVVINNNVGNGDTGLAALLAASRVRKIICSFPRQSDSHVFDRLYRAKEIELELTPQGTLAERIRAAGAGTGAFFTPTGFGTPLAAGKEHRVIDGRDHVVEYPLHADYALVSGHLADPWGQRGLPKDRTELRSDHGRRRADDGRTGRPRRGTGRDRSRDRCHARALRRSRRRCRGARMTA